MARTIALPAALAVLLHSAACSDQGVTAVNASPEALITSHADGDVLFEGDEHTFTGIVSDADHQAQDLLATWRLGGVEICAAAAPTVDGSTACVATVGPDDTPLTLEALDPQGAAGVMAIDLEITPTDAPSVTVLSPTSDGVYYSDRSLDFVGEVSDPEEPPDDLEIWWESSEQGTLDVDTTPDAAGVVSGTGLLAEGVHTLTLSARDGTDKTGSDTVTLTVGPPNSPPTCEILAPESGSAGEEGASVTLEAAVSDEDVPSDRLTVTWTSDKDGELSTGTASSAGEAVFSTSALSVATHTLTLTVADEVGETCTDLVLYTVGLPPEVTLTSPATGDVYNEGTSVTFAAQVSDNEDRASDLALSWDSSLDGTLSTQGADSSGLAQFVTGGLSAGEHVLTLTVTDSAELFATALATFTVNAVPTAPTVTLSPDPAITDDTLIATASGSTDPDGSGTVAYTYAWYESGSLSSASSSASFPASATTKGLTYRVVVTPSDGTGDGEPGEAELTIGNSPPELTTPVIDPSGGVTTSETLTCAATASDADGDSPTLSYAWSIDGSSAGAGDTLTLSPSSSAPGDTVTCTATATDDEGDEASASTSVTVDNSAPAVDSVSVTPSSGVTTSSTLTCAAEASDPDEENPSMAYAWSNGASSLGTGDTLVLTPSTSAPGDSITCTATATDGAGDSDSGTASVTVDNSGPSVDAVSISPATGVTTSTTLSCSATASDPDDESPSLSTAWTVDGGSLGAGTSLVLTPSTVSPGDTVVCTATATDGHGDSDTGSDSVTVDNSAPSLTSVSISPDPAYAADTLSCAYGGYSDPDGDADASTLAWTVDGTSAGSGATLAGAFLGGDTVTCTVTPSDGSDSGTPVSDSLVISNTPPVLVEVTLEPDPAYEGDTLSCTPGTTADDDGDSVSTSTTWDVDGVDPGETADTLSSDHFGRDETVTCTVTPSDGSDSGDAVASNSVTISNTAPSISSVSVTPPNPSTSDTLTCSYFGYSDADGDADASTYAWTVDGTSAGSGSTLSTSLSTGDSVTCTVTPHDGTDAGTADSDSVTVANAVPVVDSVSLSPASPATDDTLVATVSTSDDDGDSVTVAYTWFVDGAEVSPTGSSLDGASWFDKGQEVFVVVVPSDGADEGDSLSSDVVTIVNTPPGAPTVAIEPSSPTAGVDDLVCVIDTDATDADGDSLTYTMSWSVDGLAYGSSADTADTGAWVGPLTTTWTDDTVAAEDVQSGDTWTCVATPHDGEDDGDTDEASVTLAGESWSGTIEMPATDTVNGYSHGEWSALNCDGRVASRMVLTSGCTNPELALYQHADSDTSIHGSYYVMDGSGSVLDDTPYESYSGCNDCWLPGARLTVTLGAGTTYYLGFQNTGCDMSGPSIYLDADARTVGIATFDDPRADAPGTDTRGLSPDAASWQNRWRVDCE